ncbi:MAG TPA: DUF3566 domain-containing protein [Actinomycetota bacterium]|nr:DUF3566 domain-containing protein [Actinomycetota bacterium]
MIDVELGQRVTPARSDRARAFSSAPRRTRVTVRRFGLFSVFRFSILFSFCMMVMLWLALLIIFLILQAAGVMDSIATGLGCLVNPDQGTKGCLPAVINGGKIFGWLFVAGCIFAVAWSGLTVFVALLYNLISDILGGVEVTLAEKRGA